MLDPTNVPIVEFSLNITDGPSNLTQGITRWQVSAVFGADYSRNPSGESLPSTPVSLNLPDTSGMVVTLRWAAIPNAVSYIVYRQQAGQGNKTITWNDTFLVSERSKGVNVF